MSTVEDYGRITPGERRELRSVVRQQFKVLRTEVEQRRTEMLAEVDARLAEKYREEDRQVNEVNSRLHAIAAKAMEEINAVMAELGQHDDDGVWRRSRYHSMSPPTISRDDGARQQLKAALQSGVSAQVKDALLALDRQEADLLRELALDALETSAARGFLGRIPTVGELVPSRRLREIENEFDSSQGAA